MLLLSWWGGYFAASGDQKPIQVRRVFTRLLKQPEAVSLKPELKKPVKAPNPAAGESRAEKPLAENFRRQAPIKQLSPKLKKAVPAGKPLKLAYPPAAAGKENCFPLLAAAGGGEGEMVEKLGVCGNGSSEGEIEGGGENSASGVLDSSPTLAEVQFSPPQPLYAPQPEYPLSARQSEAEGKVQLKALISKKGEVLEVKLLSSCGDSLLDLTAQKQVKSWKFKPAVQGENQVLAWVKLTINFTLK